MKKSTWCYSTFSSAQVCAEACSLDRVTTEWNTLCKNLYGKHPPASYQPLSCMGHCTAGMSMCECMYKDEDVPISPLLEARGLSWNFTKGRGKSGNLRGGYPTAQTSAWSIHSTTHWTQHTVRRHRQRRSPFQSQDWKEGCLSGSCVPPYQNAPSYNDHLMTTTTYDGVLATAVTIVLLHAACTIYFALEPSLFLQQTHPNSICCCI